jgi:serine/threonine protein kinase
LLQALAYLHERGFAHRDVKPANAMLSLEEQKRASVKLVDFSLCHDTRLGSPPVHAVGTVMFMPPEMIAREPHDVLCDIWSLGITAVYLLTGRGPWKSAFDSLFLPASETSLPKLKVVFSCRFFPPFFFF